MKILIVDDDVQVLRTLGNTFTTLIQGYLVLTATTANQGINYIKQERPEIIIMDVRLGPASGMDLLEDYPKHSQGYRPHMIVITAYDDEKVKERAKALGVDAFLLKPFDKGDLQRVVLQSIKKYHEDRAGHIDFLLKALDQTPRKETESREYLDEKLKKKPPEASA